MESTPSNMRNSKIIFFFILLSGMFSRYSHEEELTLYIGTGGKKAEGIYRTSFNEQTGRFSDVSLAAKINSPGFLCSLIGYAS